MKKFTLFLSLAFISVSLYANEKLEGAEELMEIPEQAVFLSQLQFFQDNINELADKIGSVQCMISLAKDQEYNQEAWRNIIQAVINIIKQGNGNDKEAVFAQIYALIQCLKEQGEQENGIHGAININFGSPR